MNLRFKLVDCVLQGHGFSRADMESESSRDLAMMDFIISDLHSLSG
jgi:hypothetical protein